MSDGGRTTSTMRPLWRWGLTALPAVLVLSLMLPGLGYRHLFVDEAETGGRALTILDTGLPRTIDSDGQLNVNAGGLEIEDGDLHRYTPWMQFYVAAAGVAVGDAIGVSRDASLRAPAVLAHAAAASMLQWGLSHLALVHPVLATAVAVAFALQTHHALLNRIARYHAILDFLVVAAVLLLARAARQPQHAPQPHAVWRSFAVVLVLLPNTHTLGGAIAGGGLVLLAGFVIAERVGWPQFLQHGVLWWLRDAVLPLTVGVVLVALLSRPWLQGAWGEGMPDMRESSLNAPLMLIGLFAGGAIFILILMARLEHTAAAFMSFANAIIWMIVILDQAYPFSQFRYYAWLPMMIFAFVAVFPDVAKAQVSPRAPVHLASAAAIMVLCTCLAAEALWTIAPFHGVRVLVNDVVLARTQAPQPLREALRRIARGPTGPVSVDYVPQYVNWYLPHTQVALVPEPSEHTVLNNEHPIWQREIVLPLWDLFYREDGNGTWHCRVTKTCQLSREWVNETQYQLRSQKHDLAMCVVQTWAADPINHSFATLTEQAAFTGAGRARSTLVLARRCDVAETP